MADAPGKPGGITPSQTVGPFFAVGLTPADYGFSTLVANDLTTEDAGGEPILIEGHITDGAGVPVPDAMIEIWQADGAGRYPGRGSNTTFRGFGRSETRGGVFAFRTVKPGPAEGAAPHINVNVFARGVLFQMTTRIYFEGERANDTDLVMQQVPADRRQTLIAKRDGTVDGVARYVFDIRLQGENETVFFAV